MPKLLQPKTIKKQKSLDELHEEITKNIGVFDLPTRCNPDPNFVPEPYEETYEEWLEEMEYEESIMTPEEKEESKRFEQKFWSIMKQIQPDKFKGIRP